MSDLRNYILTVTGSTTMVTEITQRRDGWDNPDTSRWSSHLSVV